MSGLPLSLRLRRLVKRLPGSGTAYRLARLLFRHRYNEDGLLTVHNADFMHESGFIAAYGQALRQGPGTEIRWRSHVLQWAGQHAAQLDGDFVECGVNRGFLSRAVMAFVEFQKHSKKRFFLIDTYAGLVPDQVGPEDRAAYWNDYRECYEEVVSAFRDIPNAVVVRGVVPDVLPTLDIARVAYLSIDMNCAYPERAALEYFWPKMVPGALAILDDYGFSGHESQKRAADEFAQSVGVRVLSLPTGQGLILKPPS